MVERANPTPFKAAAAAAALASRSLGSAFTSRELRVAPHVLEQLERGDEDVLAADGTLEERLLAWIRTNYSRLLHAQGHQLPPFDHFEDFWHNFYRGPRDGSPLSFSRLRLNPTRLVDFDLSFPLGVPACALTPNASYIGYFAARGFDLVTYKTVRDRPWKPHPYPQWAFAVDADDDLTPEKFDQPVAASMEYWPAQPPRSSLVNSFGVPSLPPDEWQRDVEESKRTLSKGQVLMVSVMGSPEVAANQAELVDQFARAAAMARDAGADIVEVNLSCPNTGDQDIICRDPEMSALVLQAVTRELRLTRTPVFIKVSYLPRRRLEALIESCARFVQGIVAINTVSVPVIKPGGRTFFDGRERAGLSGAAIKGLALEVARGLTDLRESSPSYDFSVIGVGGVMDRSDFEEYREVGVDAVQTCSGAWMNPDLALDIRGEEFVPLRETEEQNEGLHAVAVKRLGEGLRTALLQSDDLALFAKHRLERDAARQES